MINLAPWLGLEKPKSTTHAPISPLSQGMYALRTWRCVRVTVRIILYRGFYGVGSALTRQLLWSTALERTHVALLAASVQDEG